MSDSGSQDRWDYGKKPVQYDDYDYDLHQEYPTAYMDDPEKMFREINRLKREAKAREARERQQAEDMRQQAEDMRRLKQQLQQQANIDDNPVPPLRPQANLPANPVRQHEHYEHQDAYPHYNPNYNQRPAYQGYQQDWRRPPPQPAPVYYQQPPQQRRQANHIKEYEPTMEELNWIAVEERLATYRHERKVELEEEIRQQEIAEIHRKLERLKRAQIDLIKEQRDLDLQRLERIMKKSIEIKKEKLSAQNVPSKEDEVIPTIEEPKGEEENPGFMDYEQIFEKSVESVCIAEISTQISDSNISSLLPLQVSYPIEQITLNKDSAESVAQKEHEADMMDEKLQLVPSKSIMDMPTTDFIFPLCLDISIKQNIDIICSFNLPSMIYTVVSSHMQNFSIKEALDNNKVWSSLKKLKTNISVVRAPKRKLNSEKLRDRWRTNWKTRKKGKRMILYKEDNLFSVCAESSHSEFVWKPGWDPWERVCTKEMKKVKRGVQKFDGVHPWAPNIW